MSVWRPLQFIPPPAVRPSPEAAILASQLQVPHARPKHQGRPDPPQLPSLHAQAQLTKLQFPSGRCASTPSVPLTSLPLIGFGQAIEYLLHALAQAARSGSALVIGRQSSPEWSSKWFCGDERSLRCYANVSGCCGDASYNTEQGPSRRCGGATPRRHRCRRPRCPGCPVPRSPPPVPTFRPTRRAGVARPAKRAVAITGLCSCKDSISTAASGSLARWCRDRTLMWCGVVLCGVM